MELYKELTLNKVENGFVLATGGKFYIFNSMYEVTNWLYEQDAVPVPASVPTFDDTAGIPF